ncbi:LysR family transcriptional regulator [Georgenia sp. EYE_87]|uniref:LysR family transcriptional regulator n=1 Tax=Georgenia sp. EYE_87 TaxID=2853448 RepID=UPI002006CE48|nr:LysR family transcriptional regulator [Georgenia sp. EYE_87]MCK6208962.1 LysR family transcriptional regulator [Georgenia sp. EYE_87]
MDLNRIDLNLLVALDALLAERSVTRAAERLSVGQSAMSATLARLRRLLGDEVLQRRGRTLVPTPLAEALVDPLRDILARTEALLSAREQFDPATAERTFTITANDYVVTIFLTPLLVRLAEEAPGVHVNVVSIRDDYVDRLRRHETDLLIMPKEVFPGHTRYPHQALFVDRYVCAVDADNPDIAVELDLETFSRVPYLAVNIGQLPSSAELRLDALGILRSIHVTTQAPLAAPFMLRGTRMLMMIQERLGRLIRSQAGIRLLEPPVPLGPLTTVMIWGQHLDADPAHGWLRERAAEVAAELLS